MKIAIIYTTTTESTKKSCKILSGKINADVQLIPIGIAKSECILKYNFIILAGSALNGKVQSDLKLYISKNIKTLKGKPLGLIINCEANKDRFNKTFTEELVNSSYINSNFGYELNPDEGNYIEKRKTNKLINDYKKNKESLPTLNIEEIDKFADYMNTMIEKRVD
ncbi:MAG: flavodoxin [Methanobrevibacter sp.]|uniref:flavodoxin domain-containing protein n=1 Tax=Methanobrevibacter sp. TaxID=66852 RepID=UPI001B427FA5|nr:flavodoxin domain-containing protein [Methanobrevibacter sp.]MBP3792306.1 flavodoxin [Methanobrevibacter sp.]